MEGGQLRELAQILLYHRRVVLEEEPLEVLRDELEQTQEGQF